MLWLGNPGGRLESAHRLKKLMVGATRWLQALTVLGDVRRDPEIRGILSPNCNPWLVPSRGVFECAPKVQHSK